MIRFMAVCAVVGMLAAAASANEAGWETFTSQEGGFSASFPGPPKEIVLKADGNEVVRNVRYQASRDGITYDIGYIAYVKPLAEQFDAADSAEFARLHKESTIKRTVGTILGQKDVTLGDDKRAGYELLIQVSPRVVLRQRVFYANGKLYQLIVSSSSPEAVGAAPVDTFLDSFRLVN